jgi:hypothetical protein
MHNISRISSTLWAACPTVTINGVLQPREHGIGVQSSNVIAGKGGLIVAAAGRRSGYSTG